MVSQEVFSQCWSSGSVVGLLATLALPSLGCSSLSFFITGIGWHEYEYGMSICMTLYDYIIGISKGIGNIGVALKELVSVLSLVLLLAFVLVLATLLVLDPLGTS